MAAQPFQRALGRHVEHDPRSRSFSITKAPAAALRSTKWTHYGPILDQKDLGACTCFATLQMLQCDPFFTLTAKLRVPAKGNVLYTDQDAIKLYELATKLDKIKGSYPPDDTGSSGLAACKAAKQEKIIASYHHAFGIDAALHALQLAPVITGINWYEGFDAPIGTHAELQISGRIRGGHEITITEIDVQNRMVRGLTSWGPTFGDGGFFIMTWDTWTQLLNESGDVTAAKL